MMKLLVDPYLFYSQTSVGMVLKTLVCEFASVAKNALVCAITFLELGRGQTLFHTLLSTGTHNFNWF